MSALAIRAEAPGPTLLLVAGLHGNEPAGVEACERTLARLRSRPPARGDVVALVGNRPALAAARRFLARDLNRQWTPAALAAARASASPDAEEAELARLAAEIDEALARARGPVFVLDLHSTSAAGVPFTIIGGTPEDAAFARRLEACALRGLAERAPGTLTCHLATRGCVAVAVEGGRHGDATTLAHLEAAIALALAATGVVEPGQREETEARALLAGARRGLPPLIDCVLRHEARAGFVMKPGFTNIERTAAGTPLATEDGVEILAPFDGYLLLPLYQSQGEDGFFYGREGTAAGPT